jgi:hypothetical protein
MAKATVFFEDVQEGVSVRVESDPGFPGPDATEEEKNALTDAQKMCLRLTEILTEEMVQDHVHDENCNHNIGEV